MSLKDKNSWDEYFNDSSRRLGTLVGAYSYIDDIGRLCGIKPDYWRLFWRNPLAVFAPYDGCSFRLNEPENEAWALQHLRVQMTDTFGPTHDPSVLGSKLRIWIFPKKRTLSLHRRIVFDNLPVAERSCLTSFL